MLKLILKNLWARRRRNVWLLAELILVSIVTWIILDPVIVTTYDRSIPLGYDTDRLCLVTLSTLQPQAPGYDEEAEDSAMIMKSYFNLTRLVKDYPGENRLLRYWVSLIPILRGMPIHLFVRKVTHWICR